MDDILPVKILIVDDREENHISLKAVFDGEDYTFIDAFSGREALRILLEDTDFTLIIMDVLMPGMDGFETVSYISKRKKLRDIPVIFLTAKDAENQMFKAFGIGAVDYISKPVIPELLRAKVNVFMELSLKNRALEVQKLKLKQINDNLKLEINERKASERKIKSLNNELKRKLSELEALDAFSYSVAHDFKSPLNNISLIAHLLKSHGKVSKDEQLMEQVNKIDKQIIRLGTLINDLLLFSHQETVIHKSEVDMSRIVPEVIEELKFAYGSSKKYQIEVGELPTVYCNESLIKQVWANLISNAIKYSSEKECPMIRIEANSSAKLPVFSVKDNGIGFNSEEAKSLFALFKRLESAKRFEGSGVGLALVKRIVEKHGGKIWAESEPGVETTFSFYV